MAERVSTNSIADRRNATDTRRWWLVVLYLLVLIVGGYAAALTLVAGFARALPVLGLARSEAVVLASMCGFLFYLALLIWGTAQPRISRLALGLTMAGGLGLALLLTKAA
jgi:hypothetical protein